MAIILNLIVIPIMVLLYAIYDMFGAMGVLIFLAMVVIIVGTMVALDMRSDDAAEKYKNKSEMRGDRGA